MAMVEDIPVTAQRPPYASIVAGTGEVMSGPAGIWTLDGDGIVVSDADGPATVLVPGEAVTLLAVDLPVASHAKRIAALPFAIEDMIAEPIESVHIALGVELSPKRYLVGVVRHDRMAEWIARIEDAGLEHAALVPDSLALPRPAEGEWAVDLGLARAVVRAGDGTGFALPAALLRTAWEAAGRPWTVAYGAALPDDMAGGADGMGLDPLSRRLLAPVLDLRQGMYARRRRGLPSFGRRLAKIVALGVLAHAGIAAADTVLLRRIADNRAEQTRALVTSIAPGTPLPQDDLVGAVTNLLPQPAAGGVNAFLPAAARLSGALAPLGSDVAAQAMRLEGGNLTMDIASADPAMVGRVRAALSSAGVQASVAPVAGGVRIVVPAA